MKIHFFCFDLDQTLLGDSSSLENFKNIWDTNYSLDGLKLCYNTGRSCRNVLDLIDIGVLPKPDFIIGSVGTEIFDCQRFEYLENYWKCITSQWKYEIVDRLVINFPRITRQDSQYQNRFKSSWYLENATEEELQILAQRIRKAKIQARIIYSGSRFLDILPLKSGKGFALTWLSEYLKVPLSDVLVAGDSLNDLDAFNLHEVHRIVVANAETDFLKRLEGMECFFSNLPYAAGVMEGIRFFLGKESDISPLQKF